MRRDSEQGRSILVVEDDHDNRITLVELLESYGHSAVGVGSGRAALNYLAANDDPCLILLDLMMPEMSGYEFMELRDADPRLARIPVVLLTGTPNVAARQHPQGAVLCLFKPVDPSLLIKVVGIFCRRLSEAELAAKRS